MIVHEIVRLLTGAAQKTVCLGERSIEGKDIVILVRSHFEAESFRKALAIVGIKTAMQSRNKVSHHPLTLRQMCHARNDLFLSEKISPCDNKTALLPELMIGLKTH